MIQQSRGIKHYRSARERELKAAIMEFFERELVALGPVLAEKAADIVIEIFEKNAPPIQRIKHGQMLWNALDKNTKAGSESRKLIPVILSVVTEQEISLFEQGKPIKEIRKGIVVRLIKETYEQGGIMSTRDLSLILCISDSLLSCARIEYEEENDIVLPHQGVLHDMGTTITHKKIILRKYLMDKKDSNLIASETNHSQKAVDNYIKNFNRVRTLLDDGKDILFIHIATNIAKETIRQYQDIYNQYVKEQKKDLE